MGVLLLAGCAPAAPAPGAPPAPRPAADFDRPLELYRRIGLLTGPDHFPAVAGVATLAGAADSTLLLFGLSLPNSALQFQRDGGAFYARYNVSLRVLRDDRPVRVVDRQETVRVADFPETARTDETVVFQAMLSLQPGRYVLELRVRDGLSARGFEAGDTVVVPAYGPGATTLTAPIPVYRAVPRTARSAAPDLVLNPRRTAAYGGEAPRLYMERYDGEEVRLTLRRDDAVVHSRAVGLQPAVDLAAGVVELPVDSLPLGRLRVEAASVGAAAKASTPLLVTLTDRWLVENIEELLGLLAHIASEDEIDALRTGSPEERRAAWDAFWDRRDPVPATPGNEYREQFFERVRIAGQQFGEGDRPGWLTDRGEVYIVLGPPSHYREIRVGESGIRVGEPNAEEWVYGRVPGGGQLVLLFVDPGGAGRYRLTPVSEAAYRTVASRLRGREGS